jgi:hypothetical protein
MRYNLGCKTNKSRETKNPGNHGALSLEIVFFGRNHKIQITKVKSQITKVKSQIKSRNYLRFEFWFFAFCFFSG